MSIDQLRTYNNSKNIRYNTKWLDLGMGAEFSLDKPCWLGSSISMLLMVVTLTFCVHDGSVCKPPETFHETGSVDGSQLMPRLCAVREFSAVLSGNDGWLPGLEAVHDCVIKSYFLIVFPKLTNREISTCIPLQGRKPHDHVQQLLHQLLKETSI